MPARGRARNEAGGQRTLLTYLRGKQGVNDETGGASSENLLRGRARATWGAVAATFVDTTGHAFTALRVFFAPATATSRQRHRSADGDRAGPHRPHATCATPWQSHTVGKPLAPVITATWPSTKLDEEVQRVRQHAVPQARHRRQRRWHQRTRSPIPHPGRPVS